MKLNHNEVIQELNRLKTDDVILFNQTAETYFKQILCECLNEFRGRISQSEALAEIAFRLNVSVVTAKRYLTKHLSVRGQFEISNGFIQCKIHNHFPRKRSVKVIKKAADSFL